MLDRLRDQARRAGLPSSRLAERLIDEGLRETEFRGIVFRSGPSGRRAGLLGGPDVWEIVGDYKRAQDAGAEPLRTICETTPVDEDQIMLALAYYRAYPEEVDDRLRADDEAHARLAGVVGGDDAPA